MNTYKAFPTRRDGHLYMCEGGTETEFMYKHGFELPHFATFPLLENPKAASVMRDMYPRLLPIAHLLTHILSHLRWSTKPGQVLSKMSWIAVIKIRSILVKLKKLSLR